jgi:hypothetical protein
MTELSDLESTQSLLFKVRGGDEAARRRLYEAYMPGFRRWAHGRLPSPGGMVETDDLVNETFSDEGVTLRRRISRRRSTPFKPVRIITSSLGVRALIGATVIRLHREARFHWRRACSRMIRLGCGNPA